MDPKGFSRGKALNKGIRKGLGSKMGAVSGCLPGPADPAREVGVEQLELGAVARELREIYEPRYAFPAWAVDSLESGQLESYAKLVTVYHLAGAEPQEVRQLVREREPVNIAMRRHYDKEKLKERFGFSTGAYRKSTTERLMPNIAIYCKTPMRSKGEELPAPWREALIILYNY